MCRLRAHDHLAQEVGARLGAREALQRALPPRRETRAARAQDFGVVGRALGQVQQQEAGQQQDTERIATKQERPRWAELAPEDLADRLGEVGQHPSEARVVPEVAVRDETGDDSDRESDEHPDMERPALPAGLSERRAAHRRTRATTGSWSLVRTESGQFELTCTMSSSAPFARLGLTTMWSSRSELPSKLKL